MLSIRISEDPVNWRQVWHVTMRGTHWHFLATFIVYFIFTYDSLENKLISSVLELCRRYYCYVETELLLF